MSGALSFKPVTGATLAELERFSMAHGKFRYCSCMRWRLTSAQFKASTKDSRAAALATFAKRDTPVGVLAYQDGEPVGWCSIAPRESYAALERYRALPRLDDKAVWSIVCFFIDRRARRKGLTVGLIRAAVDYARSEGAKIVEAYPVAPGARLYTYMGSPHSFSRAGFRDVTPDGGARTIMRRVVVGRSDRR